jgi:hypothetical protein
LSCETFATLPGHGFDGSGIAGSANMAAEFAAETETACCACDRPWYAPDDSADATSVYSKVSGNDGAILEDDSEVGGVV